jgi:hypothetical protein
MHQVQSSGTTLVVSIISQPSLSRDEGARLSEEACGEMGQEARRHHTLVLDLRQAPDAFGPTTHAALVQGLAPWADRKVLVIARSPLQRITVRAALRQAGITGEFDSEIPADLRPPS